MKIEFASISQINDIVIHVRFNSVSPSGEQFESYLEELRGLLNKSKEVYLIYDTTYSLYIPREFINTKINWLKTNSKLLSLHVKKAIHVIPNAIQRSIYQNMHSVYQPPIPYAFTSTLGSAYKMVESIESANLAKL
ncbi:hypothetical protein R9C00_25850 [Flammeovirgaceae bacterium SG7u.111]|nr:hypothetical protein [Flammeovirgaceae bacterium SG7u.132]WPO35122.1 hypothetical protein R9C00_25850 [Flammeovirgaceae bacterium SG7u.111]